MGLKDKSQFVVSMVTMHLEVVICGHVSVMCNWLYVDVICEHSYESHVEHGIN